MNKGSVIQCESLEDYFKTVISVWSALQPKSRRLAPKAIRFIIASAMLLNRGYDIEDYDEFCEGLKKHYPEFKEKSKITQYKTQAAQSTFVISKRGVYKLPPFMDLRPKVGNSGATTSFNLSLDKEQIESELRNYV